MLYLSLLFEISREHGIWFHHHSDVQRFMCEGMIERKAVQLMMLIARHFILAMMPHTRKKKSSWRNDWYV